MSQNEIRVQHHFRLGPEELFAKLAEHENLSTVFAPAKVKRLSDGTTERNGVGSKRRLNIAPGIAIEETVTAFEPSTLIQYKLTKGGAPMNDHLGTLRFTPAPGGGTDLVYTIMLASKVPGAPFIVNRVLKRSLVRGLPKVDIPG